MIQYEQYSEQTPYGRLVLSSRFKSDIAQIVGYFLYACTYFFALMEAMIQTYRQLRFSLGYQAVVSFPVTSSIVEVILGGIISVLPPTARCCSHKLKL